MAYKTYKNYIENTTGQIGFTNVNLDKLPDEWRTADSWGFTKGEARKLEGCPFIKRFPIKFIDGLVVTEDEDYIAYNEKFMRDYL